MATTRKPQGASKPAGKGAGHDLLNLTDIRALARMVSQYDLSELELENGVERLCIRRDRGVAASTLGAPVQGQLVAPVAAPAPAQTAPVAASEGEEPGDGSVQITSPFVGTFYRAPSPESPAFVEADQKVKKGQVLCIVEAMKLMNEIEAETDCTIAEILVKNAEPVEFGQPLFRVFPAQ